MSGPPNNVIQLRKVRKKRADQKSLCDAGFHKWVVQKGVRFDVKEGKLLTSERCERCGKGRTRSS